MSNAQFIFRGLNWFSNNMVILWIRMLCYLCGYQEFNLVIFFTCYPILQAARGHDFPSHNSSENVC